MPQEKLEKLKQILVQYKNKNILTEQDFIKAFKVILKQVKWLETELIEKINNKTKEEKDKLIEIQKDFNQLISDAKRESDSTFGGIKRKVFEQINFLFAKNKINEKVEQKLNEVDKRLNQVRDGEDGKDADEEKVATEASKLALNELKGDWIGKDTIKDLKRQIKAFKKQIKELAKKQQEVVYVGGGSRKGGVVDKAYDLSDQLDGVTKIFALPSFWRIISVHSGGSIPTTFRPITDYTVDGTNKTITFTDEISSSTTLAAGQTIIVVCSE